MKRPMFHVEPTRQFLPIHSTRRLVTEDEEAAYLKRVQEARSALKALAHRCQAIGREFQPCDKID